MDTFITKFKEPSTIRGIFLLMSLVGFAVPEEYAAPISHFVVATIGLLEVARNEYIKKAIPSA